MPFDYLHYLLKALSKRDQQAEMEDLLPWNVILNH
nr:transposase domain-containing protein [Oleiphilus sp. HI0132]